MYAEGARNRPQMGVDFDLDAHLAADNAMWGEGRARAKLSAQMSTLDKVQLGLDVVGMSEIPVISQLADVASAGVSFSQGDKVGGTLSLLSAIPIIGKAAEGTRLARTAEQLAARAEAAANIRQARTMLREAKVPLSAQHEIIRSFDMETFRVTSLSQDTQLYRFFDDAGKATLSGRYATADLYANQTDRITKLALPSNAATRAGVATVPAGTTVFTGKIAPQPLFDSGLIGGGNQTFIMGSLDNIQFKEISIQSLFKGKR